MEKGRKTAPSPTTMAHVVVVPYPSQGHINPMLQFAKRLASKGPRATLVTTRFIVDSLRAELLLGSDVAIEPISDSYDAGGAGTAASLDAYLRDLEDTGAESLVELIERRRSSGQAFTCMVFDTYVPWAAGAARRVGLPAVAFSTQSAAASSVYHYVRKGMMEAPCVGCRSSQVFGLPALERWEFPSMALGDGSYPTLSALSLSQFDGLGKEDMVLFNTFMELETEVISGLKEHWNVIPIGPTVPSMIADKQLKGDDSYDVDLLKPESDACMRWLSDRPDCSVVYVSFGSFATLTGEQMGELAQGLALSGRPFLWVIRATEQAKLPPGFAEGSAGGRGLVVTWCPQLAVLSHPATGCFVTHCGWNSTLEALALGVPMVAVPQWTDQPANAKYVEEVWGVGVRAMAGSEGAVVAGEEVRRCVAEVMGGERAAALRANAMKWKELVRRALSEGGSSDEGLNEFVEFVRTNS